MTKGLLVSESNSQLFASWKPRTLRANSITAVCIPRQTPRYGNILFAGILWFKNFPFNTSITKSSGNQDTIGTLTWEIQNLYRINVKEHICIHGVQQSMNKFTQAFRLEKGELYSRNPQKKKRKKNGLKKPLVHWSHKGTKETKPLAKTKHLCDFQGSAIKNNSCQLAHKKLEGPGQKATDRSQERDTRGNCNSTDR